MVFKKKKQSKKKVVKPQVIRAEVLPLEEVFGMSTPKPMVAAMSREDKARKGIALLDEALSGSLMGPSARAALNTLRALIT